MSHAGRFDRQVRFAPLGAEGQAALERARVVVVGCGALGGVLAQTLVRAGVGRIELVDRDIVELSNLPRQVLFSERHAQDGTPKALAAAETLAAIGGPSEVVPHALHLDAKNLLELAAGVDLLVDGTDNLETRYLLNDFSIEHSIPWVYAGVVGGAGLVMPVIPGESACLRCVFPEPPPPGTLPTCDTAGVILPAVGVVASMAAGLALRLLVRDAQPNANAFVPSLIELDAWNGSVRSLRAPRDPDCPACAQRDLRYLHAPPGREPVVLCGRNTVQLPARARRPALDTVAANLPGSARDVVRTSVLLRFAVDDLRLTLFRDGRALVEGTQDADRARAFFDRVVGT